MQPLLIILLLLSILTNVLLILLLLRSGQQNTAEDQTDEIARIVRDLSLIHISEPTRP
mgnify:FL=1